MPDFPAPESGPTACLLPADVSALLRTHLDDRLRQRFEELTGLLLHVLWHEPHAFHDLAPPPVLCPLARDTLQAGRQLTGDCATCQRDHWCPVATVPGHRHRLQGVCGAYGFWATVQAGSWHPVTLVLHATVPSLRFNQATQLLQQVRWKVETALTAEFAARELAEVLRQPQLPQPTSTPTAPVPPHPHGPHAHAVVQAMLDRLHTHYHRPLDLSAIAADLGMNASYLSSLFVATMGVRFHHYLNELRLAKAQDLLCDPLRRIGEVAAATGFASPNHFDNVFKTWLGVSPSAWRAANRISAPPEPPRGAPERKSKKS